MTRQRAKIRWVGDRSRWYGICLGLMNLEKPPRREFNGGDETFVEIVPIADKPGHVDLYFEDGEFALEVGEEYYEIVELIS